MIFTSEEIKENEYILEHLELVILDANCNRQALHTDYPHELVEGVKFGELG